MFHNTKIILASGSPRRKELLLKAGFDFDVVMSNAAEKTSQTKPDEVVKELSYIKAENVFEKIIEKKDYNDYLGEGAVTVIGADTVVAKNDFIMGKPKSASEAFHMIRSIQDGTHQVYTGVTIFFFDLKTQKIRRKSFAECTEVTVFPMTDSEIDHYISAGDWRDKAGAYGIQGIFGMFVKKINGDYNNVVGLPISRLYQELKSLFVADTFQ